MEKTVTVLVLLIMTERIGGSDWWVTVENRNPCVVNGSTVEFRCSYGYREGETVRRTAWYKGQMKGGNWTRVALSGLPSYENRSVYTGDRQHDCSLAIHHVQESDGGYYFFHFDTDTYGRRSKSDDSVFLSVTELSAVVYPQRVRAGDEVTLECGTSCYRPPSMVWFKDGRPVASPEFRAQPGDSGNYSCAIGGRASGQSDPVALDVQYAPLNTSIEVSHPGHLAEGRSVNLTCSSAANPAVDDYTWFRADVSSSSSRSGPVLWVGSGQVLTLPSGNAPHTGLYLCQARNSVGGNNSTELLLTSDQTDPVSVVILSVGIAVKVAILLALPVFIITTWKKTRNSAVHKAVLQEQCDDYENVLNTNIANHLFPGDLSNVTSSCNQYARVDKGASSAS